MSREDLPLDWCEPRRPGAGKPRVIVIGAGISGMSTGVYAQMNGMDSRIYESYVMPGGCCTGWVRKGYTFDYCIEWLIGSGAGNAAHQVWQELGALDGKTVVNFEMFNRVVGPDGREVTFYNDPDRLEQHLLEVSPQDEALIRSFCADVRRFVKLEMYPVLKPDPLKTWRERLGEWMGILPSFRLFWRSGAMQMDTFADKFRDPLLRRAMRNIFFQDPGCFPVLPYLYNLACAHKNNAGFPQGGSLALARSVEARYKSLGGRVHYRARVEKVLVEDGRAVGVELKNGTRHYADYVVSACDGHTTIYKMLQGRYVNDTVEKLYKDLLLRPDILYPGVVSVFLGVQGEFDRSEPHTTTYLLSDSERQQLPSAPQGSLVVQLRSHYSDSFTPPGRSVIHCTYFSDYAYWHRLRSEDRKEYWAQKRRVADFVRAYLERLYPGLNERVEVVNVSSPATTQRYTGNHNGSILAWKAFTEAEDLANKLLNQGRMQLPGLQRFYMAGQWIGGGGLIRAASSGRYVVQYICDEQGRAFQAYPSQGGKAWHVGQLGLLHSEEQAEA
ncbi:phytoene desaturase family protein [Eleftheria terrae]|uniref:phytoene desaturase family protein n=1 Tax=Eleftheria terrae TaxID=1597781 RepID=UPI00263B40DF|nr:NAD(P)/FAD-dependent oxidoreductase [Eleftheria terrae]WKB55284.1 NAD(P)/FAD-dependent oxidoreductase [Eleftheria terrae]